MLQICKNYGIFQFRYTDIAIYKYGAVINPEVSKISLYRSSTETHMSLPPTLVYRDNNTVHIFDGSMVILY